MGQFRDRVTFTFRVRDRGEARVRAGVRAKVRIRVRVMVRVKVGVRIRAQLYSLPGNVTVRVEKEGKKQGKARQNKTRPDYTTPH